PPSDADARPLPSGHSPPLTPGSLTPAGAGAAIPAGSAGCAAWMIRRARIVPAASATGEGSWLASCDGGAGTWSGSRLSCAGCTVVLLARRLPCSLLRPVRGGAGNTRNHLQQAQQITGRRDDSGGWHGRADVAAGACPGCRDAL